MTNTFTPNQHRKKLADLIKLNANRKNLWDVFSDFVEMAALAISNSVDLAAYTEREERYLRIVERYEPKEVQRFSYMFGELTMALEGGLSDVLGPVFEELGLANQHRGQFFTPWAVSSLMGSLQVGRDDEDVQQIEQNGFVTCNDPACGSGAMLIAFASAIQDKGINYQQSVHVTGQDIDSRAVHMAYVQLSLLNIPAVVILGNSLLVEERERWYTPAHVMGLWPQKIRRGYALGSPADLNRASDNGDLLSLPSPPPIVLPSPAQSARPLLEQLALL